jgi:hypothetical protein
MTQRQLADNRTRMAYSLGGTIRLQAGMWFAVSYMGLPTPSHRGHTSCFWVGLPRGLWTWPSTAGA